MSVFGVILFRIFPHSNQIRRNTECAKMRTRKTPNTDTFYAVIVFKVGGHNDIRKGFHMFWDYRTSQLLFPLGNIAD